MKTAVPQLLIPSHGERKIDIYKERRQLIAGYDN
jgi:hypothetical protein